MELQTDIFLKERGFSFVGEHHHIIKQAKGIISNSKPNPANLFIAEGLWSFKKITELNTLVFSLIICPDFIRTEEAFQALKSVAEKCSQYFAVSQKTFEKITERDKPDGLIAIAKLPSYDIADFKFDNKSIVLVLDGIEIPGNIGTMLRTADGAGLDAVFILNKRARLSHPKVIKGSMGAVLSVPVYEFADADECRSFISENKFNIYLADTRAEKYYFEEPFGQKTALIMGSERYGISREWYNFAHTMISIPMLGRCDSLNVGVAATVLCYEAAKRNKVTKNM